MPFGLDASNPSWPKYVRVNRRNGVHLVSLICRRRRAASVTVQSETVVWRVLAHAAEEWRQAVAGGACRSGRSSP
eukprot:1810006-Prymnesium_polylepis.2